jgi:hypothetical protein
LALAFRNEEKLASFATLFAHFAPFLARFARSGRIAPL